MKKFFDIFRTYFLYFIVYAFLGWIYEVVWFIIMRNKFVNRGFLFGPYLPIYGFGALILYFLIYKYKLNKAFKSWTPVFIFFAIFIITTIVEFVAHYVLDTYFGIILWDYSKDYLNIDGRVCFAASRNFAIGGTFCLYFIQPLLDKLNKKLNSITKTSIFIVIFPVFILDFIITIILKFI